MFYLWFFSWIVPIWAPDSHPKIFSNSERYSYLKVKICKSALSDTALIPNQCCQIQCEFWISVVGYSSNSELVLYPTTLIASKEKLFGRHTFENWYQCCRIQWWFRNSIVRYIADSKSALNNTVLIHEYSADSIFNFKSDG